MGSFTLHLCQPCVNRVRLPIEQSVSVELIWNIPEAFMAKQSQAISCVILPKSAKRRYTLAGSANPRLIKTHNYY